MTTSVATSKTGANSFSGIVAIAGAVSGAASTVQAIATSGSDVHQAVFGGGGILLALGSVIAKLAHDKGIHVATIQQAGSDVAAQLPQIKDDISRTIAFIEQDVPGIKSVVDSIGSRITAVEGKAVPTIHDIENTVRTVLTSILGATPVVPAAAPVDASVTSAPATVQATA